MTITVILATYGDDEWMWLAYNRAFQSLVADEFTGEVEIEHQPDGTRASSLNTAAERATGDWLIFLDADDELAPGYVGAMRRAAEQHPDGDRVLFTPAVQHIRKGRPGAPAFMDRGISLRDDNWLVVGTMIHRNLFNEVGGFDDYPHGFEDWALWSKCYRLGATIVKVPDAVYRYFHNPQSKHKQGWRDHKTQVATHIRIKAELDAWEAAR